MKDKCSECGSKMSVLIEAGNRKKYVCRNCGNQLLPIRDSRPICPRCGLAALCVLSPKDHPGKLLFVHHSGERIASGCLVDTPDFEAPDK
jgi:DNA-directed RNA polymerase subunit RPC12/RpoP